MNDVAVLVVCLSVLALIIFPFVLAVYAIRPHHWVDSIRERDAVLRRMEMDESDRKGKMQDEK